MRQQILDFFEFIEPYRIHGKNKEPICWIVHPRNVVKQQAQRPKTVIHLASLRMLIKSRKALIAKAPVLPERTMVTANQAVVIHAPANSTSAACAEHHLGVTR
jgi:hypothetical protein